MSQCIICAKEFTSEEIHKHIGTHTILEWAVYASKDRGKAFSKLTLSEIEVMDYIIDGVPYKDIADKRFVSVRTTAKQIGSIFRKLGMHSSRELITRYSYNINALLKGSENTKL